MSKIIYLDNIKWLENLVLIQKQELNKNGISDEIIVEKIKGKTSLNFYNIKSDKSKNSPHECQEKDNLCKSV